MILSFWSGQIRSGRIGMGFDGENGVVDGEVRVGVVVGLGMSRDSSFKTN